MICFSAAARCGRTDGGGVDLVDRAENVGTHDAALGGGIGNHDDVVLVLPPQRLPLGLEHADDAEGDVLDAEDRAERVLSEAEQLLEHRLPEHGDARRGLLVALGEGGPSLSVQARTRK